MVIAKRFAHSLAKPHQLRVLSLTFADASDYDQLQPGDTIRIANVEHALTAAEQVLATVDEIRQPYWVASQVI